MSIINDALKKTEEDLQKNTVKEQGSAPKPSGPKPWLLYILILVAGLFLGNFIFGLLKDKIQAARITFKKSLEINKPQTLLPPATQTTTPPPEEKAATSNYILSGIFISDHDGYALINNRIVRKNDYVDGAKVGLITTSTVELDNAGQTITLSINR